MFFINLCIPLIIFILFFVISLIHQSINGNSPIDFIRNNIFIISWGAVLAILCQLRYTITTWIIFLCPIVIMIVRYTKTGKLELNDKILTMPTKKYHDSTPTPTSYITTIPA